MYFYKMQGPPSQVCHYYDTVRNMRDALPSKKLDTYRGRWKFREKGILRLRGVLWEFSGGRIPTG